MITQNSKLCEEAKPHYYDCLCDESCELVPEFVRNHIELCQHCQKQIKQLEVALSQKECIKSKHRQNTSAVTTMLELHFAYIGERVNCETVRPFLPGMLDPAIDIRIPTPITVHLDNCPQCIEDLKAIEELNLYSAQLYRLSQLFSEGPSRNTAELSKMGPAVSDMIERENSEIITVYHMDESAKDRSNGLYSGFPIRVEVLNPKEDIEQPVTNIDFAALKENVSKMHLKPFLKTGIAAAAVILIGFAILLNTTSAEADVRVKISNAIKDLTGVYISTYSPDRNRLLQEIWISDSLKIHITKTGNEFAYCDIGTGLRKTKNFDTGEVNISQLNKNAKTYISQQISRSLGLTPVYDISDLPRDYEWLPVDNPSEAVKGFEIYDLKWNVQKNQLMKWRFFIDPKTFLPREIEIYKTSIGQGENLEMVMLAEPISDSKIRKAIQDAGLY